MILIGRRALLVLALVVVLATTALGIYGYEVVGTGAGGTFGGQEFLYVALLIAVLEILVFVRVFIRSRNIERELDKLIEITRFRGLSSAQNLNRLGPIGAQISRLYDQLNALSEKKSLKIGSMSELIEFLMNNVSVPAIAATVDGKVAYASRLLSERTKRGKNELIGERVEELAPGLQFSEIVAELDRVHSSIERKAERTAMTFYPIRNRENHVAYVVCVFQGNAGLVEQIARSGAVESSHPPIGSRVRRFLDLRVNRARRISKGGSEDEDR